MLREDKTVRRLGASTDMRFRRIIRYRRKLRVQADLEYAHALIDEHDASDVEEPCGCHESHGSQVPV